MQRETPTTDREMNNTDAVDRGVVEAMGISEAAYEEIMLIVGRTPTVDELSTLLAMWKSCNSGQGLLTWLRGQPHIANINDYIVNEREPEGKSIKEPRIKECLEIARGMGGIGEGCDTGEGFINHGDGIYMVGDVSELFVNSEYGRKMLHLVDHPAIFDDNEETESYISMILDALYDGGVIQGRCRVSRMGLFGTLVKCGARSGMGFDILTCREVRLDAFLFGEAGVRYVVNLAESNDDLFLQKLTDARLNCCFLGRTTRGRVLVDGMDFGERKQFE